MYDIDKIRNLEHGQQVLESLWKIDKEDKALNDLFKADKGSDKPQAGQSGVDGADVTRASVLPVPQHESNMLNSGEKRKSVHEANTGDKVAKKIKTDDGEESQTEHGIKCSHSDVKGGKVAVQMISDVSQNATETESNTGKTYQDSKSHSQQPTFETMNDLKTNSVKSQCRSHKEAIISPLSSSELLKTAVNREGIKSLVTVLDSLRGKLITDIETANQFNRSYRTLKDLMKTPTEEDQYERVDFKCTNLREMFEELDKRFGQIEGELEATNEGADKGSRQIEELQGKETMQSKDYKSEGTIFFIFLM